MPDRFDKARDETDNDLAEGKITPAEHRRLMREIDDDEADAEEAYRQDHRPGRR